MASFLRIILIVCAYGFLKEFKPTEPYLYEYEHITLNISSQVLSSEVYPIWTYAYLAFLIPVFLLTDILLYKPVVILEALSYLTVWLLFDFGRSVLVQQILEGVYGVATATEIAYFAYIYMVVDRIWYKRVTSLSRGALLAGKFCSYTISQLIIVLKWGDYMTLNWISTVSLSLSLICALFLPMVSWRAAYERRFPLPMEEEEKNDRDEDTSYFIFAKKVISTMWRDTVQMYSDSFTFKWSLWWALASCIDYQVQNYIQTLWGSVQTEETQYNGITEAVAPALSIPMVLFMERVNVKWRVWGESTMTVLSLVDAGILLLLALTPSIFIMYGGYIVYRILYEAMITISQFNLASRLEKDSFGLLFGLNTFIALALQTVLTLVVSDKKGPLHLSIRPQFYVYSGCHVVVGVIFGVSAFWTLFSSRGGKVATMQVEGDIPIRMTIGEEKESYVERL